MSGFSLGCLVVGIASFSAAAFSFTAGYRVRVFSPETMDRRYSIGLLLLILGTASFVILFGRLTNWMHL